jgi:hypothetical protein
MGLGNQHIVLGLILFVHLSQERIQPPGLQIVFDLLVPNGGMMFGHPGHQFRHFFRRQLADGGYNFFDTHKLKTMR